MNEHPNTFRETWKQRIRSLQNVPILLSIVWNSGRGVVVASMGGRVVGALIPITMLAVSKRILDAVQAHSGGKPLSAIFWYLVAAEAGLAVVSSLIGRATSYFDGLLADRFTRHVSIRVMEHASQLDLASYEDPIFYDKLERARVQGSDRIAMVQAIGSVVQQALIAISLAAGIVWFSPWLLVALMVAVVPAFVGESHFAFQGYALNIRQTPLRRQLDYLRTLGASKESAKELKLFHLSDYLCGEYTSIFRTNSTTKMSTCKTAPANRSVPFASQHRRLLRCVRIRDLSDGDRQFELGFVAISGGRAGRAPATTSRTSLPCSTNIADQSLFLTDLVEFLRVKPQIASKPDAVPAPRPIRQGFVFEGVSFSYPGTEHRVLDGLDLRIGPGERIALIGENGQGKTTIVKLLTRLYDPTTGRILLDGVDLRDYSMKDLHRQIGVIFQDFVRLRNDRATKYRSGQGECGGGTVPSGMPPERAAPTRWWTGSRADTSNCWAGVSKAASTCPAASGRRWRSPVRIYGTRKF